MRVSIRAASAADGPALAAIYAPFVEGTAITFESVAPDGAEMGRRIEETIRALPWLVAESDGQVAGFAYAHRHRQRPAYRWAVETSVWVRHGQARRGVGRLLYSALLSEVESLGYVTAWAGIALPNEASEGLHRRLGFEPVGVYERVGYKHGAWRDVRWYRAPLAEPADPPAEPRAWGQLPRTSSA